MAIDYTALFTSLGKIVKHYNAQAADGQALLADVLEIEGVFQAEDHLEAITGLNPAALDAWKNEHTGRRGDLASYAANRLADPDLADELNAPNTSLSTVLPLLIEQMIADSETINASAGSSGAVTAFAGNIGDGTVLKTLLLDRVSSPGSRQGTTMPAHHNYGDLTSELVIAEDIAVRCIQDSYADGVTEGGESFSVTGELADDTHGVATSEGSGSMGNVTAVHGSTSQFLSNADFETFTTTDTPDSWTINAGTVTTHIQQATGSDRYHGDSGLKFLGDGAQASMNVSQVPTSVDPGRRYIVTARVKASATIAAGALTIQFEGTGYTAGGSEKISVAAGSLPTTWTLYSFNVLVPLNPPDDWALVIKWTGTPTNAKNLWIDDIGMAPVDFMGGFGINVVRGATPFVRDDRFTFTNANTEGVFQKFFRRVFGYQLPSDAAAGETISDTLAT